MNKKLFGTLLMGSLLMGGTFVSCQDYDDEINDLQVQITNLQSVVDGLKKQIEAGAVISSVNTTATGVTVTLSNGQSFNLTNGKDGANGSNGADGKTGSVVTIGENGNWVIDGVDTGLAAAGKDGINGTNGQDGKDGAYFYPNTDGYFHKVVGTVDTKTETKWALANGSGVTAVLSEGYLLLDGVAGCEDVISIALKGQLKSLVFVPDYYYNGIEATKVTTMNYPYYESLPAVNADTKEPALKGTAHGLGVRLDAKTAFKVSKFLVNYHLNPANADVDPETIKINILSDDKAYTRAAAAGLSYKAGSAKVANGDISLTLDIKSPEKVKSVADDEQVTVFATEITVPTKSGDIVVTSDYAALNAEKLDGGYVLSINEKASAFTKVYNEDCGDCALTGKQTHLFKTWQNAAETPAELNADHSVKKYGTTQAQVKYNSTLDLRTLVETHYVANDALVSAEQLAADGLTYKFELAGLFLGGNQTSESAHAAIAEDGYTLRPQMPTTAGKQAAYGATEQKTTTIGRTPLVRVQLVAEDGKIMDYGYILVVIGDKDPEPVTPPAEIKDKYIEYTGAAWSYQINEGCLPTTPANWNWANTWEVVEYDLYHMLGLSKAQFDENYTAEVESGTSLKQYEVKDNKFVAATAVGTFQEQIDLASTETTTLKWSVVGADLKTLFGGKAGTYSLSRAVKYVSKNKTEKTPDVYVLVNMGTITVSNTGKASGVVNGLDNIKINEYWYNANSNVNGKAEAHINVYSVEDEKSTTAEPFEQVLAALFKGNKIDAKSLVTYTDPTTDKISETAVYDLVFDASNEGKEFKGQTQTTYVLTISADGKTLSAYKKGAAKTTAEVVAKLVDGDPVGINTIKVVYQHGEIAEDLLNYKAHNELSDDFLKVVIGITAQAKECALNIPLTNNTFVVRFLRPLNVKDNAKSIEDAKNEKQIIKLADMVSFTDWREYWADGYEAYYDIKSITVRDAVAGEKINELITTNMHNGDIDKTILSTVSNLVEFKLSDDGKSIEYTNNSSTVQEFKVKIPVRVSYIWGNIDSYVTVTVKGTHEN